MIPEGWTRKRLGKVAYLQRGFDLPKKHRMNGVIPIISSSGVSGYHSEPQAKAPGVITGRYGSIGNVFYVEEDYWPLNTALWVKDFYDNHPKYIYYLLSKIDYKKFSDKTGVPGVNRNDLHSIKIPLPPTNEQTKIANILSTWDKAIDVTEKLIKNSQAQKKALMLKLLAAPLLSSESKFKWKFARFDELFSAANDKKTQIKSSDYLESGKIPIIDQGKKQIAGFTNSKQIYLDVPVIIFGDHTRIIKWVDFAFCPGADGTQVLKTKKSIDLKFGFYLISNADIPNLGYSRHMRELKEKEFKFPSNINEQRKIATILSAADKEIELLRQKLDFLKQEKKALMQQLLTGKRRVKVEEDTKSQADQETVA